MIEELPRNAYTTTPCVYFLMQGEEVVYVGQTINLVRRMLEHRTSKYKQFDRVLFIRAPQGVDILVVERRLIAELKPRLNSPREIERASTSTTNVRPLIVNEESVWRLNPDVRRRLGLKVDKRDERYE
jgi:hypothetical protein